MTGLEFYVTTICYGSATKDTTSLASGINFYSGGPEHAYLKSIGRVKYVYETDEAAFETFKLLCRTEGILPAFEPSFADICRMLLNLRKK